MRRLERLKVEMLASADQQFSLSDPDSRSMATSGRGSGVVGYNVQIAVEANHHLIVMHEVTNDGTDRSQLSHVANETKAALGVEKLDAVADRGYFNSEEIRACEEAGITVTLPKPSTSNAKAEGRFGKQDFRYVADEDIYVCPAGEKLAYHYTTEENGLVLRRYWTNVCQSCAIKPTCTTGKERRITRWEHEHILEAVQRRLDEHPEKMRQRRDARPGLQSDTGHEHHGHSAAHGRDEGLANAKKGSSTPPHQNCYASILPAKRFYTTKTRRRHEGGRSTTRD